MLKSHEKFHSANGKRLILVVDDELINRELMRAVLEDEYELIFADNGQRALELINENKDTLSLILLDLMMPVLSGTEVLRRVKVDSDLRPIPIIVLTADQAAEIESLSLGAADFIPKPYPNPGVIRARILRSIELSEDREIIQSTERDPLTKLYNREYFYRYAEQFDQHHRELEMDAIIVDVNHFHMVNERFGTAYGDEVLRHIAKRLRETVSATGGIVCRRGADTFMVYCPHGMDYQELLDHVTQGLSDDAGDSNRVRLRMGIYAKVDKELEIERRFNRAKMAADTVRNSFTKTIALYDDAMHDREVYAEQLIEDFPSAIRERQFEVYYQPKFDIRPEVPELASAEALIRWKHPSLGMINPGFFIPLFEENGLIQQLDTYVWRTAAAQVREWRDRLGFLVPVSVNVSRVDMYDAHLVDTLRTIINETGVTSRELYLEITESAYTQDSGQIVERVVQLRDMGFKIEMDDFGAGYSSLNMIGTLPIDALKLDMQFIRSAFNERKDTRMIEIIIDIADYLKVPVIAEGVETEEQLTALRAMGCDLVQGYYFSRPLPCDEFERFVLEHRAMMAATPQAAASSAAEAQTGVTSDVQAEKEREQELEAIRRGAMIYARIAQALTDDYFCLYYVDTNTDDFVECSASSASNDILGIGQTGGDFLKRFHARMRHLCHPEDHDRLMTSFTKLNVLHTIDETGVFSLTFRMILEGVATYVHLKAARVGTRSEGHIAVGINDIDAQVRRNRAYDAALRMAREASYRDALTGVKSRRAYAEDAAKIDADIEAETAGDFGIAIFDVNDLKEVNDTQGHTTGDQLIVSACHEICGIFTHSPVYRYGGDEFAIVLRGEDYARRDELVAQIAAANEANARSDGPVVACGLAIFEPDVDLSVSSVFRRADIAMYENKKQLKNA